MILRLSEVQLVPHSFGTWALLSKPETRFYSPPRFRFMAISQQVSTAWFLGVTSVLGRAPAVFSRRPGHRFIGTALLTDMAAAQRTLLLSLIALNDWNASSQTGLGSLRARAYQGCT